jgi:hypothetical protein
MKITLQIDGVSKIEIAVLIDLMPATELIENENGQWLPKRSQPFGHVMFQTSSPFPVSGDRMELLYHDSDDVAVRRVTSDKFSVYMLKNNTWLLEYGDFVDEYLG